MNEIVKTKAIFNIMEEWAPTNLAYDWDNVGLQIGSYQHPVKTIMVTLDVTESVVDEAIKNHVDLIIAHHPILFKPVKQIDVNQAKGRIIKKLIKNDITVYASHTNLDIAKGGVNDLLADKLGIQDRENLLDIETEKLCKLVVYVPETHAAEIRRVLGESGAGHIGNYSHSTFNTRGQGMFKPLEGTSPYLGELNQIEVVDESRIETIIKEKDILPIVETMIKAHPYEEVAYDIFPLKNKGPAIGIGRIGSLPKKMALKELANEIKRAFGMTHLRVTGDLNEMVEKIAILGGSGEGFIDAAKKAGADVYVTGDMTFHHAQDAMEAGLSIIDAGHYIEKIMKEATKSYLEKRLNKGISVIASHVNTDPFQFI